MNIVVLNGSPRKGGNTEIMAETCAKGVDTAIHILDSVFISYLYYINIKR